MEPTTQVAGEEARQNEVVLAAARDEAVKAERLRATNIRTMANPFKLEEKFVNAIIDEGLSVETARERIMTKLAAQWGEQHTDPVNPTVTMGADATRQAAGGDGGRPSCSVAIPATRALRDAGREYAGLTLVDIARECLEAVGVKTRGMSRNEIARVALQGRFGAEEYFQGGMATTSDFPNILANVANKTLRQAYEAAPRTFVPFCRQVSAADFKPINRVQLSDVPTLPKVNEKGRVPPHLAVGLEGDLLAGYLRRDRGHHPQGDHQRRPPGFDPRSRRPRPGGGATWRATPCGP